MTPSIVEKGIGFVKKQQSPFKVNMAKNIVQNFSLGLTQQYQSIYIIALGATALELGYVASIGGIAFALITLPVGILADKYGIRRIMMAALLLMAGGYAIFGGSTTWEMTAAALVLTSISWEMTMNVCPMICGASLESVERVTGMQLCDTVAALPRLFAPIVAAFLITQFGGLNVQGIRPLYWIEVGGILVAFAIIWKYFTNPPRIMGSRGITISDGVGRVFKEGVNVKRWLLYCSANMFPTYMAIYIPLFAKTMRGAQPYSLGLMDAVYWGIVVVLAMPVGLSADRFGRKNLITMMCPLYALGLMVLAYVPGELTLIAVGFLTGFIQLAGVTSGSISVELVPKELLGSWYGIIGMARSLSSVISPLIGGLIWNSLGPVYVLYFLAATQLLKLVILWTMPKTTKYS
jgi:MFS family permease